MNNGVIDKNTAAHAISYFDGIHNEEINTNIYFTMMCVCPCIVAYA